MTPRLRYNRRTLAHAPHQRLRALGIRLATPDAPPGTRWINAALDLAFWAVTALIVIKTIDLLVP